MEQKPRLFLCYRQVLLAVLFVAFFSLPALSWGQQKKYTVHGFVTEKVSGEPLIGAAVMDTATKVGIATDSYGHYSLTLPAGEVRLLCTYVGNKSWQQTFLLTGDTTINIALTDAIELGEVVVTGHYNPAGVSTTQLSAIAVPAEQIKKIPAIFGENDVIKALQLLPGVQGGTEGTAGIYVRGGGPDQNLFMMDGVPIYNVNHLGGLFSNFNADAVKNVTLYKGSFPARFGGRLSSVVDVRMKDGDDKHYHGNVSVGLISSKLNLEGPIIKEKTTFNLSARRTYLDLLIQPAIKYANKGKDEGSPSFGYYFYDTNLKLTHKINDRNKLFFSGYIGDDVLYGKFNYSNFDRESQTRTESLLKANWNWGNAVASARWNYVINPKIFLNTTFSFNRYRSSMEISTKEQQQQGKRNQSVELGVRYDSGIQDWALRSELSYAPNPKHKIQAGVEYIFHTFRPDVSSVRLSANANDLHFGIDTIVSGGVARIPAHEVGLYAEDDLVLLSSLSANIGLRGSLFNTQGRTYFSVEPRAGLLWKIRDDLSAKLGYAMMTQYVHLLSTNNVSLPTDLWVPVTKRISPMTSHQVAGGLYYTLDDWGDFSVEGYYKHMNNLLEFRDGASFLFESRGWEDLVYMGRGRSYGVELMWQRSFGSTTGWIAYTWARSLRTFDRPGQELNNGKEFPFRYDRIHDFTISVSQKVFSWLDLSATWVFRTGDAGTMAVQSYAAPYFPTNDSFFYTRPTEWVEHIPTRNNFRFPNYHRLDLSANMYKKHRYGTSMWTLSVYNAYVQKNPFLILPGTSKEKDASGNYPRVHKYVTIFPIIPSISYTYTF